MKKYMISGMVDEKATHSLKEWMDIQRDDFHSDGDRAFAKEIADAIGGFLSNSDVEYETKAEMPVYPERWNDPEGSSET